MIKAILILLCGSALVAFTGCSTLEPGQRHSQVRLEDLKKAYLVIRPYANLTVSRHIGETLNQRGVSVRIGTGDPKPTDVDFVVTYTDKWDWDMAMYLKSLNVQFLDATNGQPIASGSFHQGFFHGYPDLEKTVHAVIESIYIAK